jgi:hypothetical protein
MAEIVTYEPGAYCQLKLASGERVLVSCAQSGIKIMKVALGGLIPTRTIVNWSIPELASAIDIFADEAIPMQHPLEAIKNKLLTCSSIKEIEQLCTRH